MPDLWVAVATAAVLCGPPALLEWITQPVKLRWINDRRDEEPIYED